MDTYRLIDERFAQDYFPGIKDTLILVKEPIVTARKYRRWSARFAASNVSELNTTGMSLSDRLRRQALEEGFLIKVRDGLIIGRF